MTDHSSTPAGVDQLARASLHGSLHITPSQVEAVELSANAGRDLVSLRFGDDCVRVSLLGTLSDMFDVLMSATVELGQIQSARRESEEVRS